MNWYGIGYTFIRFAIPLFFATMAFALPLEKRKGWQWRLPLGTVLYTFFSGLIQQFSSYLRVDWFLFNFLFIFVFAGLCLYFVTKISLKEAFFYAATAYLIQNLVDNANVLVYLLSGSPTSLWAEWLCFLLPYFVVYPVYYFVFVKRFMSQAASMINNVVFFSLIILSLVITYVVSMYANFKEADSTISLRLYAIFATALELLLAFNVFNSSYLQNENDLLERLLAKQNDTNARSQENYELLSTKIHDLRHQIRAIKEQTTSPEVLSSLEGLEKQTRIFNNSVKTGNKALDTILSENSLYCSDNNILFSCMADGAALSFMDELDLYSLFDNAVENAIEALKGVEEGKRTITISVKQLGEQVFIHVENYSPKKVAFIDGMPQSSKADSAYHGYGTKSIAYIAKKYHGIATFYQEDDLFKLSVYFPLKQVVA